jgi:2-oxoisovalerate dehydrogenase E1 component
MTNPNRAEVVDQNFLQWVKSGNLPQSHSRTTLSDAGLTAAAFMDIFESQMLSRHLDLAARRLRARNLTFYTIGSSGHEGNAVHGRVFRLTDMAFLHYRSGAFFIQRSKQLPGSTPIFDGFLSLSASAEDPISEGRHKVFGSLALNVPPQTSTIASHLPKAVGAALSVGRAKDMQINGPIPHDGVVLCSFGDASSNHATALAAINAASLCAYQGLPVPLVFVCEDNGIGISVPTPDGWVQSHYSHNPCLRYLYCDGLSIADAYAVSRESEKIARQTRKPVFLHMRTIRLLGHAGSDVETTYRSLDKIQATERQDPLLHSARTALEYGLVTADELISIYQGLRRRVDFVGEEAVLRPKLEGAAAVMRSILPPKGLRAPRPVPSESERLAKFGERMRPGQKAHFAKIHNMGLADVMLQYPNTLLFGEDVARKGGVYNVTTGLLDLFGPKRVFNSHLDETSILGNAIGMAHNGFIPIPEIQFLAYVHNAEDQIRGEAATLSFFSSGKFQNPMVVRIAGLAYQKGFGGHFHNDNSLNVFRDIPGLVVVVPSNGSDAVKLFRHAVRLAHEDGRVVIFIEPIALYMTKDLHKDGDGEWQFEYPALSDEIKLGEVSIYGEGQDVAIVTYGNGYYLSRQAAEILRRDHGIHCRVIDIHWILPIADDAIIRAVAGCQSILIVEECRKTGSVSEQLATLFMERLWPLPPVKINAAQDCFIPLGATSTVTLPSKESIVASAVAVHELTKIPAPPVQRTMKRGVK